MSVCCAHLLYNKPSLYSTIMCGSPIISLWQGSEEKMTQTQWVLIYMYLTVTSMGAFETSKLVLQERV